MAALATTAPDAPADGWLRHDGWEYRGDPTDIVELRFRNGLTPRVEQTPAGNWRWQQWRGGQHDFDIVEYRKVSE